MQPAWMRAIVVGAALLLLGVGACADDAIPEDIESRLAALDTALQKLADQEAELERQRVELEALRGEIEALRAGAETEEPAPPEPEPDRYDYFGYTQVQAEWLEQSGYRSRIAVRRFFNVFDYRFDDETQGRLLLNTSPGSLSALDAWVETSQGDISVRAGQFIPPSGFDAMRSSSVRLAHEYATAWTRLFPGIYDIGVMVGTRPDSLQAGRVLAAVHNGPGPNVADNDDVKDVVIHYVQPFSNGRGRFHVTHAFGQTTVVPTEGPKTSSPKDLWAAGASHSSGPWTGQAEVIGGRAYGARVLGGYAEGAYTTGKHVLFGRYDYYNPDASSRSRLVAGPRVGYEYHLGQRSKVSLEYSAIQDAATSGGDGRWAIRWQARW